MNILLIDKRVSRYKDIVAAIDPALAVGIVFDYFKDTFATLKTRIEALGLPTTGNSVGLIQHNYKAPMFSMLASADVAPVLSVAAQDPELAAWAQFKDFIAWCKTELNTAYFDMMACALYSNPDWKHVIDTLPGQTGVTVRASTDNTGSATLGGDWFLESHTGANLKTVYFTELIEEYRGVLYIYANDVREYSTKGFETGGVVAWGDSSNGGDSSLVASGLLSGVVAVYSTAHAFAALKTDGSIVVWGDSNSGGTDPGITGDVVAVYSTYYAFAALKTDGSIVVWGDSSDPGITGGVVAVYSTYYAFAALKTDGSVVTWGDVEWLTHGIVAVYSNEGAFAALKSDGSVVAWGDSGYGGTTPGNVTSGVVAVYSNTYAFAALKTDGSVVAWGNSDYGGTTPGTVSSGVVAVYSNNIGSFAALKTDGSVVAWGYSTYGETTPGNAGSGVVAVYSNENAFAALKIDGSVVAWGNSDYGGASPGTVSSGVVAVYSTQYAFAALKTDGSVVAWGDSDFGGDSTSVASDLSSNVVAVYSNIYAFAALKADGSVVAWGYLDRGAPTPDNVGSGVVAVYSTETAFAALKTTATTFNLSAAHYRDMDRYNILRKKENRRRVNLTTLNNNVFTLSAAQDLQMFNPAIPSDKTLRIIVPDYVASSYSITSTATIPSDAGSFIVACDEGEPVTISGTTYVNYGSYIYKRETDNTYTKLTSATINDTLYTLYGGDGINSSGIGLVLATTTPTSHWASGAGHPYALAAYGSYMYVGQGAGFQGIDRYNLSDGSLDTEHWVNGEASNMFNISSMVVDSPYLYVAASTNSEINSFDGPTNIFKISLADASIVTNNWAPEVALVGNIAIYGAFMYAVHISDCVIRKLNLADGSVANANFATVNLFDDPLDIIMNIDDAGTYMYVQRGGRTKISKIAMSDGSIVEANWNNISSPYPYIMGRSVLYGPSMYISNISNGNTVQINLASRTITDVEWATSADWIAPGGSDPYSRVAMTVFGSSLYFARTDTGVIDKFTLPAVSNICFPASAPVQTDQGIVAIAQLDPAVHTVQGISIVDVTKTVTNDSFLVCIGRDALGKDYPVQDTVISRLHKLEYGGRMVEAEWFVNRVAGVERIPYSGETLYNVILAEPRTMRVNNLVCETLLPSNPIAKLYARSSRYTEYTRDIVLSLLKTHKANNNREAYRKVLSSL